MIRNRTAQLIFQTFYVALGLIGIVACLGVFDDVQNLRWDFYVHFTNLSNFLCIGVMLTTLIQTARKKEDSYVTTAPLLKFIGMLGILLTFLVFNILRLNPNLSNSKLPNSILNPPFYFKALYHRRLS